MSLALGACSFDSGGGPGGASAEIGEVGSDGADDGDDADEETSAASNDASATDPDDGSGELGGVDSETTVGDSEGPSDHPAVLVFVESPAYDFTLVPLGMSLAHVVTLHNNGGSTATGITAAIASPFAFQGGAWPGAGGTCIDTLAPDGFCQIELAFAPATLGPVGGSIVVDYANGEGAAQVVLSLTGTGSGMTANLLQNGDAETSGNPPPQWSEANGSGWTTTTGYQRNGARSITPGESPNGEVVLYQPVDVSAWAELVDMGALQIAFGGWSRTYATGNDANFFRVDFVNAEGAALDTFQGSPHTSTTWTQSADSRAAPAGTRAVVVRLHCTKASGTYCDGYFDDMSVVASYP
jgi:hypothetical protein